MVHLDSTVPLRTNSESMFVGPRIPRGIPGRGSAAPMPMPCFLSSGVVDTGLWDAVSCRAVPRCVVCGQTPDGQPSGWVGGRIGDPGSVPCERRLLGAERGTEGENWRQIPPSASQNGCGWLSAVRRKLPFQRSIKGLPALGAERRRKGQEPPRSNSEMREYTAQ